jgi:ferrochelatase
LLLGLLFVIQITGNPVEPVPLPRYFFARMAKLTARNAPTGLVLVNLGTPDSPDVPQVRRYLKQFLSDPYVIDIPAAARWLLVNGIILRTRPRKSAEAYRKIFTERGSPLLFHTQDLTQGVKERLGPGTPVAFGMRYGNPSIESAARDLLKQGARRLVFVPLYPQFSYAASRSCEVEIERVCAQLSAEGHSLETETLPEFPLEEGYLASFEARCRETFEAFQPDHVLFSYHGVPVRQVQRTDTTGGQHCGRSETCCDTPCPANTHCYRAQSIWGAHALAQRLGLSLSSYSIGFQSRLGRTKWIEPYTDHLLDELPKRGVRKLAVVCPSFVADCLETVEEIAIRGKEQFIAAGGEALELVPSLNAHPRWIEAVAERVRPRLDRPAALGSPTPPAP